MDAIRAAAYLRVSTASMTKRSGTATFDQDPAVQEQPLRDLITQRRWTLYRIYSDRARGAKETRQDWKHSWPTPAAALSMWL